MKKVLLLLVLSCGILVQAQTGIGTTTPDASAKLDVSSTNKGFLPPRVTLTSATDTSTIPSAAEGLLVYNKGSVGLQAGYYYWNGANWATIATASSAGNGVTAMDMVKLYSKSYSTASGDIANANGYSFTVPVSGRYVFDFSSSGYASQATATMTFKVRQGTTDIGTDSQTGLNNTVHVEYNGKVEVNLQSGTTYNVYVVTTGIRDPGDYDRVYYKMVAGNLPVTGQTVDYLQAFLSANQTLSSVGNILFNTSSGTGITLTNGGFNLQANKTYKLEAAVGGSSTGYGYYAWVDNTNTILLGSSIGVIMKAGNAYTDAPQDKAVVYYTPITNTTVYLRVINIAGSVTAYAPSAASGYSSTWATIQQVGSSAIINPWILSGNDVYNTTGSVGIGTNSPTAKLNIAGGGVKINSGLSNASTRPSLNASTVGNYEIRGVGGGTTQNDTQDDGFLRLSAGGGTNSNTQSSIDLSGYSTIGDMNRAIVMRTSGFERLRIDANGNLNVPDVNGNVATIGSKVGGLVNAGTFVQMDNIKATVTTSGSRGISVAAVSTPFYCNIGASFANSGGGSGGNSAYNQNITTTPTASWFGWGFGGAGDTAVYTVTDTTNNRMYRITMQIGASYINNSIVIERLF